VDSLFLIAKGADERITYYGTDTGEKAVIIFSSRELAHQYIAMRGMSGDHKPFEIELSKLEATLKALKEFDGAARFVANPDPEQTLATTDHYPLEAMIVSAQLANRC
jgi:hypothetical protein